MGEIERQNGKKVRKKRKIARKLKNLKKSCKIVLTFIILSSIIDTSSWANGKPNEHEGRILTIQLCNY